MLDTTASGTTFAAYKIFSGAGSNERGAFNSSATHYDAAIVAYKAAAGGGGSGGPAPFFNRPMLGGNFQG